MFRLFRPLHSLQQRIARMRADVRTIRDLCEGAERHARMDGQPEPGLEHFLLAALDLPDGTARHAFELLGAHPDRLHAAIAQQYADALARVGIPAGAVPEPAPLAPAAAPGPYRSKPQVEALMRALHARGKTDGTALRGAHVVSAVAAVPHGVAARALAALGIDVGALCATADALGRGQ